MSKNCGIKMTNQIYAVKNRISGPNFVTIGNTFLEVKKVLPANISNKKIRKRLSVFPKNIFAILRATTNI